MRARYEAHLPSLYLQDGENSRFILEGEVLPNLHSHVLCNNWNLCRVFWEGCECKELHVSTPTPKATTTISGLLKVAWGEDRGACSLASAGSLSPTTPILLYD